MFIFEPFPRLFLKYGTSKQTHRRLADLSPADFIGARDDQDKEHMRLYRHMSRLIKNGGLFRLGPSDPFALELQRFHKAKSSDPQSYDAMRDRVNATEKLGWIGSFIAPILCDTQFGDAPCVDCQHILQRFDWVEETVRKSLAGTAISDDFVRVPWIFLGAQAIPKKNAPEERRIERLVALDVVLFLWVVALLGSHGGWKNQNISGYIPDHFGDLGKVWVRELERFAKFACHEEAPQMGRPARFRFIATFLVSGDAEGGPMETLADELSEIERGKKRLTARMIDRHQLRLEEALQAYCSNNPKEKIDPAAFGNISSLIGQVLGFLQFAHAVGLAEIRQKYPTADLDAAFDAGLACWPELVEFARY